MNDALFEKALEIFARDTTAFFTFSTLMFAQNKLESLTRFFPGLPNICVEDGTSSGAS